MFYQDQNF